MKFVQGGMLTRKAMENGYAVPALNTNGGSYDIARAALEAAQEMNSPLILQVYEPNMDYRGFDYFVNMASFLCDELEISVPVALQVDHGHSYETALKAMKAGFTSFMFDASHDPLEENIAKRKSLLDTFQFLKNLRFLRQRQR
jgi:fructose-bisphosphate aldolase class II/tagatose 1,6-diphosphate aldolase GatY/KbaY